MQDESGKAALGSPAVAASATTAQVRAEVCYSGFSPNMSLCVGLTHMLGSKSNAGPLCKRFHFTFRAPQRFTGVVAGQITLLEMKQSNLSAHIALTSQACLQMKPGPATQQMCLSRLFSSSYTTCSWSSCILLMLHSVNQHCQSQVYCSVLWDLYHSYTVYSADQTHFLIETYLYEWQWCYFQQLWKVSGINYAGF